MTKTQKAHNKLAKPTLSRATKASEALPYTEYLKNLEANLKQQVDYGKIQERMVKCYQHYHGNKKWSQDVNKALRNLLSDPQKLTDINRDWTQGIKAIRQEAWQKNQSAKPKKKTKAGPKKTSSDRRFQDPLWQESPYFDFLHKAYLFSSDHMRGRIKNLDGLDDTGKQKLDFALRQYIDAVSPSNFPWANPVVMRKTAEQKGKNLVLGFANLLEDLAHSGDSLPFSRHHIKAFKIGKNIAATPGKVIFQNAMMQLIQYTPQTDLVHRIPLVIFPSWINKYYIFDLSAHNSFVNWAVQQGYTVFMVSWICPDARHAQIGFENYLHDGILAALNAIELATGEAKVNALGYCLGGTLLSCALAYLTAHGQQDKIVSCTLLATMLDFKESGDFKVFVDEAYLHTLEEVMEKRGYFDGRDLARFFYLLRANDMLWSSAIHSYLLAREPIPFDLLYWNVDYTHLPFKTHAFLLREMYVKNNLARPNAISLSDTPIDCTKVLTPTFVLAAIDDHIAPWKAAYATTQIFKGPLDFVLTESGHVAGIINPPEKKKYGHWVHKTQHYSAIPGNWQKKAKIQDGSWWLTWQEWLQPKAGEMIKARQPGDGKLDVLEPAPGRYVKKKSTSVKTKRKQE